MALIHHAAAIPVDGEQWKLRMEMWMEASRIEPLSEIIRGLDDMRIDYDLSRCVVYTSPLIPDQADENREARARAPSSKTVGKRFRMGKRTSPNAQAKACPYATTLRGRLWLA